MGEQIDIRSPYTDLRIDVFIYFSNMSLILESFFQPLLDFLFYLMSFSITP